MLFISSIATQHMSVTITDSAADSPLGVPFDLNHRYKAANIISLSTIKSRARAKTVRFLYSLFL